MPRTETTAEHVARDIREGRFPQRSEPQTINELEVDDDTLIDNMLWEYATPGMPRYDEFRAELKRRLDAERAAHSQTIQERDKLHEALHKTGTCPIAECTGIADDYKQKIFTHKHLDIECMEKGCQSLFLDELRSQLAETIQERDDLREQKNIIGTAIYEIHSIFVKDPLEADDARTFRESLHEIRVAAEKVEQTIQAAGKLAAALNRIKDIPNTWEMDPMGGSSGAFAVKIARVALSQYAALRSYGQSAIQTRPDSLPK